MQVVQSSCHIFPFWSTWLSGQGALDGGLSALYSIPKGYKKVIRVSVFDSGADIRLASCKEIPKIFVNIRNRDWISDALYGYQKGERSHKMLVHAGLKEIQPKETYPVLEKRLWKMYEDTKKYRAQRRFPPFQTSKPKL